MTEQNPLVSVRVITYNSSPYIIETLESVKAQTYLNIELIISDDCSTDNTVDICEDWLIKNKSRFVSTKLLTVEKNTGTSANSNRSIKASKGEWLKGIAGDDALMNDCIEKNIKFVLANPEVKIVHSAMNYYREEFKNEKFIKTRSFNNYKISLPNITSTEQFRLLLFGCTINTPSLFAHKSVFELYGLFEESINLIEDWPFYLKVTQLGCKIHYFDEPTIDYRVRESSICNERDKQNLFNGHYRRMRPIYKKLILPNLGIVNKFFIEYNYFTILFFDKFGLNRNVWYLRGAFKIINTPFSIYNKIIKDQRLTKNK